MTCALTREGAVGPAGELSWGTSYGFRPTPVEWPGGGRIQDKTPPSHADLVIVSGYGGKHVPLHRHAAVAWHALLRAARTDGIAHPLLLPVSGFRSPDHQQLLWQRALQKYGSVQVARRWVAPPGGSPHQSGRAIDFYLGTSNSSENVPRLRTLLTYRWLIDNARRFGFYPYDREPWHWEYNPPVTADPETSLHRPVPKSAPAHKTGPPPKAKPLHKTGSRPNTRRAPTPCRPTPWTVLVPLLNKHRGNIPLSFLLGWINKESGAQLCSYTTNDERGYFQVSPDESTWADLDHRRLSTDSVYSIVGGLRMIEKRARVVAGHGFRRNTPIFWPMVKLGHNLPALYDAAIDTARAAGLRPETMSWPQFDSFARKHTNAIAAKIQHRRNPRGDVQRGLNNVNNVLAEGQYLVHKLAGPVRPTLMPAPSIRHKPRGGSLRPHR